MALALCGTALVVLAVALRTVTAAADALPGPPGRLRDELDGLRAETAEFAAEVARRTDR